MEDRVGCLTHVCGLNEYWRGKDRTDGALGVLGDERGCPAIANERKQAAGSNEDAIPRVRTRECEMELEEYQRPNRVQPQKRFGFNLMGGMKPSMGFQGTNTGKFLFWIGFSGCCA